MKLQGRKINVQNEDIGEVSEEDENAEAQPGYLQVRSSRSNKMLICKDLSDLMCPWAVSSVFRGLTFIADDRCKYNI